VLGALPGQTPGNLFRLAIILLYAFPCDWKHPTNMREQAVRRGNALAWRGGIPYNPLTLGWGGPLVTGPSPHECSGVRP